ncbi:putative Phage major tail tube protein (bacteriophage tail tube protein FII) [uncultured Alphaproteobacteria bacterium]|uniref:Putative Phage major tail tube protein (Bacteriophage tail tube protein FII) n=1 Tax=uncultured Alphaproteobacteria bacterium TaxID=91750 RepID=A0A212J3S4_9PROT|nr:putative Phage major tail tube protein (bacteriophage tail tube protein FII) [uncultured Alphaproteobacteria bacterium]
MLPKVLSNFTLYIEGRGYAGVAEEITLPALEHKTEDYEAAGMAGPVELALSLNALKLEFTLGEFNTDVLKQWGLADAGGINARFLGSAISEDGGNDEAIEISVRGRWKKLDFGTVKKGDRAKLKVEMPLTYYRYSANGVTLIEIDMISGKQTVSGTDISAVMLQALGITA